MAGWGEESELGCCFYVKELRRRRFGRYVELGPGTIHHVRLGTADALCPHGPLRVSLTLCSLFAIAGALLHRELTAAGSCSSAGGTLERHHLTAPSSPGAQLAEVSKQRQPLRLSPFRGSGARESLERVGKIMSADRGRRACYSLIPHPSCLCHLPLSVLGILSSIN